MLSWLELPLILAMLVVFATGMAMLLSALFVNFRDIQPIWEVFSQILFYCLAGDHPGRNGPRKARAPQPRAPVSPLHAQPAGRRSSSSSATR